MTATIGTVSVDLEAKIARFTENLRQAEGHLRGSSQRMEGSLRRMDTAFASVGKAAAALAAGFSIAVVAGLGRVAKAAIDTAGGLGELAESMGVTTDTLQILQFGALQTGNSIEEIQSALIKFNRTIGEAAEGELLAVEALDRLNIKIRDTAGAIRPTDELLAEFAEKIAALPTPAERIAAGADLMGRSFAKLLPLFSQGARGLAQFEEAARAAGAVLTAGDIADADKISDNLAVLSGNIGKLSQQAVVAAARFLRLNEAIEGYLAFGSGRTSHGFTVSEEVARLNRELVQAEDLLATLQAEPAHRRDPFGEGELQRRIDALRKRIDELTAKEREAADRISERLARPPREGVSNPLSEQVRKDIETAQKQIDAFRRKAENAGLPRKAFIDEALAKLPAGATNEQKDEIAKLAAEEYDRTQGLKDLIEQLDAKLERDQQDAIQQGALIQAESDRISAQRQIILGLEDEAAANARLLEALDQGVDAYERAKAEIDVLNQLKALGVQLDDETIARAKELAEQLGEQRKKIAEAEDGLRAQREAWGDLTRTVSTGLEDAFLRGAKAADVLEAALNDVLRILLRIAITKPLENAFTKGFDSIGGLSGVFDWVGEFFGGGPSAGSLAGTAMVPGPGGGMFPALAEGGSFKVAGVGGIDSQFVGLKMTPGETLHAIPPGDEMGFGGDVIVNNYSPERVQARRGRGPNGQQAVIVEVGRMAAQELRRPGSALYSANRETFGSAPNLARR